MSQHKEKLIADFEERIKADKLHLENITKRHEEAVAKIQEDIEKLELQCSALKEYNDQI